MPVTVESKKNPGLTELNGSAFDPRNVPFLREAIRARKKRKLKDANKAEEAERVRELMPVLAGQVRYLVEESVEVTERTDPNFFRGSMNYSFLYEVPAGENEDPLSIGLRSQLDRIDRGVDDFGFNGLISFEISPPEGSNYLSVPSRIETPVLVSNWKREIHTDRPVKKPAKIKHIERYTRLIQRLRQGVASGAVHVSPRHAY